MKELERLYEEMIINKNEEEWKTLNEGEKNIFSQYRNNRYQRQSQKEYSDYTIETEKLYITDVIWENELEEAYEFLKRNEIKEIIFASSWSSAMEVLNYLIDKGCKVIGNEVYKIDYNWDGEIRKENKGLLIEIN